MDYGWLWFISQPLFKLLKFIHGFIGNWGFSIIIITFIVRGIMYPLTKAQYTSMAKMRMLQPKLQAMRERIGDDKQRMSQEMMALYKAEKVNPLGGCLPLIIPDADLHGAVLHADGFGRAAPRAVRPVDP